MLKSEIIEMRLRELSMDEITGVAGGDIIVNGSPPSGGDNWWDRLPAFTYDYSSGIFSGTSYFGGGGGGGVPAAPAEPSMVDTDGDGVPDSPEIVVTGHDLDDAFQVNGNVYGVWDAPGQIATWYYWIPYDMFGFSGEYVRLGQYQVQSITVPNGPDATLSIPPSITWPAASTSWEPLPRDGEYYR